MMRGGLAEKVGQASRLPSERAGASVATGRLASLGGGRRNSEGGVNEQEVFWKPARWVDYSGPITANTVEGVTLFDHPANPNHPSVFHVRNDGWMGASLTFAEPRVLAPGKPLALRYGLFVHSGMPPAKEIDARWKEFAQEAPAAFPALRK